MPVVEYFKERNLVMSVNAIPEPDEVGSIYLFCDGGLYHVETSPLICRTNQWTDFYIIENSVTKEL